MGKETEQMPGNSEIKTVIFSKEIQISDKQSDTEKILREKIEDMHYFLNKQINVLEDTVSLERTFYKKRDNKGPA